MRLSPVARLDLCEEYRSLTATAIRLRHRNAQRLMEMAPEALEPDVLAETVRRLKAWILEREEAAASAPARP